MAEFEPKQFGRFYLLEKLAIGGMAEIYKAKTFGVDGFEKLLAIKRILPHCSADKEFITMLIDEAKLTVHLSHANIVQVYDLGKVGDDYFISMEYVSSVNLRDVIYRCRERNVAIPADIATYVVSEICKGLDYAHRKTDQSGQPLGIVHRDVSPQNVLISFEGEVKIVDFGIAKAAMNISHTMAGILKGKIAYMSPEQALGKNVDHRTDIFSTGILLYETLTNQKLFTGESQFEVLKKIRSTRINTDRLPNSIPDPLKAILIKALAYYPKDRYQRAGDLQIDLTKFLYSTYPDFTPQKLAAFIRDIFTNELTEQQKRDAKNVMVEAQTSTINLAQEALQEDIVHRETTDVTIRRPDTLKGVRVYSEETSVTGRRKGPVSWIKRLGQATLAIAAVAGGLFGYWHYDHTPSTTPPVSTATGMIVIGSEPAGATITIDGQATEHVTPFDLKEVDIQKPHQVTLSLSGYATATETVTLTPEAPRGSVFVSLKPALGTLAITSFPEGADIIINGETTPNKTPTTLSDFPLNEPITVGLALEGFDPYTEVVTISSEKPQDMTVTLKPAETISTKGVLIIGSKPAGADILLNGKPTGFQTPATLRDLDLHVAHTVQITKPGFEGWSRTVKIKDTAPISLFDELKEIKQAPPPPIETKTETATPKEKPVVTPPVKKEVVKKPVEEPKPSTPPPPVKETPKETPPAEEPPATTVSGEPGKISIDSSPSGAEVFINDEYKGTTPLTTSAKPGRVKVLLVKEGFAKLSKRVQLTPGETLSLGTVKLGTIYGNVTINSSPSKATVLFDGKDIGARTPVTIRKVRRDSNHTITVTLSGYKPWTRTFEFDEDENKTFNVSFEKQ